jgi:hypothetical protein
MHPVPRNSNRTMNKEAQVRAEVETLRSLDKDELRARWTKMFGKAPPPALTKDLLGRMIAWRIQEQFYGGHDKATLKLLDRLARGEATKRSTEPRLRPGIVTTCLMRCFSAANRTLGASRACRRWNWKGLWSRRCVPDWRRPATYAMSFQIARRLKGTLNASSSVQMRST